MFSGYRPKDTLVGLQRNEGLRENSWQDREYGTVYEIGKATYNWAFDNGRYFELQYHSIQCIIPIAECCKPNSKWKSKQRKM